LSTSLRFGLLLGAAVMLVLGLASAVSAQAVAVVNGQPISNGDFSAQMRDVAGHDVLMAMIETQIITEAYDHSGMPLLDSEVENWIDQHFHGMDTFRQMAKQNGVDADSYIKRAIKPRIMLERLAVAWAPASAENLQKYFADHKAQYSVAETVTLRQIVVNTKADADKVMAALKAGTDFAQVAKDLSVDPNAKTNGGEVGDLPMTQFPPELAVPVKATEVGKYTEPIPMEQVFIVFLVEKRVPAQDHTYDQVRDQVQKDYIAYQIRPASLNALRERLRQNANVHVADAQFKGIEAELKKPLPPVQGAPEGAPDQG
jgi:parvulin-like peptidyl-prolyl isomerase